MLMRTRLLKINVSQNQFKKIKHSPCGTAEYLSLSDSQPIKIWDFIVFADGGGELLRNLSKIDRNIIHYTSCSDFCSDSHFAPAAVLCHLEECIMYLRLNTSPKKDIFSYDLPIDIIKQKICMIRLCLDLLEHLIDVKQFIDKLNVFTLDDDACLFPSSAAIMELYPWDFQLSDPNAQTIEKIRQALFQMDQFLEHREKWPYLWRLAYDIHNLPSSIYHHFAEQ